MKKLNVLTRMLLLVALLVGSTSVWGQAAVNTVLWSEDFSGFANNVDPSGNYTNSHTGTTVYGDVSVTYSKYNGGGTTQTYTSGGPNGNANLLIAKKNGTFSVAGISTGGATELTVNYATSGSGTIAISSSTTNVTISGSTITTNGASTIQLTFENTNSSSNLRIDDISVKVKTAGVDTHALTFSATNGTISVTNGGTPVASGSQVAEGATLNVEATPNTGYSFSTWTKNAGTFADESSATTTFTMPTSDATIGATFTLNSHSLDVSGDNGTFNTTVNGAAWDGTSAIPYGSTVSITAVPNSNYAFKTWDASLDSYSVTDNPLVFTMPDDDVIVTGEFVSADFEYNVTIDDGITNGAVVADKAKAKAGVTVTLTANPNSGYAHTAWNVTDESSNEITVTNNQFVMPASNVTVNATFTKVHTITYQIGDNIAETTRLDGEELNIPVSASGFAGWTDDNSDVTPSISNDYVVTDDMELYAVFVKGLVTNYQLVEADQTDWRGDYLIAYSSTIFADGRIGGTDGMGKQNTKANPESNLSGKVVDVDWGDTYKVTFEAKDDADLSKGYVLKTQDGKYNYQSSNKNGLTTSENKATAATYAFSVTFTSSSDIKLNLSGAAAGAVFRYNTDGYFRFYKDGGQDPVYLYKRTENATYTLTEYEAVNISAAGWATYATKSDVEFTDGDAYVVVSADDVNSTTTIKSVTQVPAGTPVLMKGTSGSAVVKYAEVLSTTPSAPASNYLHIVGSGETINEASGVYVLANKSEGVGFYPWTGTALAEGKVYLQLPAGAKLGGFFGICEEEKNETDGISNVSTHSIKHGEFYNLAGQRVSNPTRGLYIINGKKVIIK